MVIGIVTLAALIFLVANLLVDILYAACSTHASDTSEREQTASDLVPTAAAEESTTAHPPTAEGPGASGEAASLWSDARRQLIRQPQCPCSRRSTSSVGSMAVFPTLWTDQDPRNLRHLPESTASAGGAPVRVQHPRLRLLLPRHLRGPAVTGDRDRRHRGGRPHRRQPGPARRLLRRLGRHHHLEVVDVFLSLPFLLGALVFLTVVKIQNILTIMMVLVILGWTTIARVMRGAVLSAKNLDYVLAARSLRCRHRANRDEAHPAERRCPRDGARRSPSASSFR